MSSPLFISEVSSNHAGDIERCFKFIETSARIGCDGVKFQLFKIDELFAPEILLKSEDHRRRKEWELPEEFIPHIAKRCRDCGISFSCTPFYLQAVETLAPYVDFFKIASYELLWKDLLTACACTGKPVVVSTGMAEMGEVIKAVDVIRNAGCRDLTLLHCVSGYPAPFEEANLSVMDVLRKNFSCKVGWSDHTVQEGVIQRAVHKYDADIIEFHLDLDEEGAEFSAGHCWLPHQIERVISSVRIGGGCDGDGKKVPSAAEFSDREWRADPADGLRPLKSIRGSWNPDAS
ncbi:N-acetylneuraminate synthase family protein [Maridesulfovibrio hydrothermalis]|uniref:N-acetylneuraminic acid synthase domain protein n=1 Tax=Maridesulfovibrio hydrothermalis AM13 = DSM 14728 TaxID=1121451 RepID=L0RD33_9BACT|nr:N-acetylneuraminate synthase family protein [Maridesulfovibrio hydrothermalis]CCO23446.1 N-acetylneuraminic acid synthase domain protein [Maridesulfovibrio hydrothermalis AM13 = DSM 14728]